MGLDMYLNAKRFLWSQGEDVQIAKAITELLPELSKLKRGASFREDPVREICIEATDFSARSLAPFSVELGTFLKNPFMST